MIACYRFRRSPRRAWLGAGLALLLAGAAAAQAKPSAADPLEMLNEGYSLLYGDVSGLANADNIFLVKFENAATQKAVTDTADYMAKLAGQLKQLARDYPSLRLDLKPVPAIERQSQAAATKARIAGFAPVVGRTGADFERTLLLTLSGGLNQLRHLARVMAEAERDSQRRHFLKRAEHRMDGLYDEIEQVLQAHYFAAPDDESGDG